MNLYGTNEVYPSVWECLQADVRGIRVLGSVSFSEGGGMNG